VTIEIGEAVRSSISGVDPHGMLFERNGHLYRAFQGADAALFSRLLDEPWLADLFDAGLVRFTRSPLMVEGHDLVVEVDRVSVVSYPPEWPTVMLRDAGSMTARLGLVMAQHGLALHDAHPWNILFEGTRPVWIDLGSIRVADHVRRAWVWEFRRHFVLPLVLHRLGLRRLADSVQDTHQGGWKTGLDRRWSRMWPIRYRSLMRLRATPIRFLEALGAYMDRMPDRGASTAWSAYRQGRGAEVGELARYDGKQAGVNQMLAGLPKGTLIDIGANAGWFSRLAVHHGHRVIAVDMDDPTLGLLYLLAKEHHEPILPLRLDVMRPPGSYGLALAYAAAPERLRSDTVLALALLHHLVGRQGISFSLFARTMDQFARNTVIVEFIPREDEHVSRWPLADEAWYHPEGLIEAMAPYFRHVSTLPSSPDPRLLMLFERSAGADHDAG
jgi:hypothetical protein